MKHPDNQLDKHLASLLGYTNIESEMIAKIEYLYGTPKGCGPEDEHILPRWTEDDGECFQLICEHELTVALCTGDVIVNSSYGMTAVQEFYEEHESIAAATRKAVVRAVIKKLESKP